MPEQVVTALLRGKMTMQGAALATNEVRAVALYVTGKILRLRSGPCSRPLHRQPKFSPGASDWNGWGVTLSNARYQPQSGFQSRGCLPAEAQMGLRIPSLTTPQAAAQPTIVSGRLFCGKQRRHGVLALDASTGCVYWTYDAVGVCSRTGISVRASRPKPKSSALDRVFRRFHRA